MFRGLRDLALTNLLQRVKVGNEETKKNKKKETRPTSTYTQATNPTPTNTMPFHGPVNVKLHKKDAAEVLRVGPMTIRVYEDGSLTENRVSGVLLEVPAGKSGPPMHWHRFHDELFFVTKGAHQQTNPSTLANKNDEFGGCGSLEKEGRR